MLNKVIMMGRMATEPELRKTKGGVSVTSFRIAVDRRYVAKGEERQTDFFNVTAWRGEADFICKHFHKGYMILVEGEMQTTRFTDKHGSSTIWYEIVADSVFFTGEKKNGAPASTETPENTEETVPAIPETEFSGSYVPDEDYGT